MKRSQTRDDVHRALACLIQIEPGLQEVGSSREDYEAFMQSYREPIAFARQILRQFVEEIEPKTLSHMQEVYDSFCNDPRYRQSGLWISVVRSALEHAFNGVGPWDNHITSINE